MIGPELLAALAAAPDLPDAACAGRWELFDPPEPSEDEDDTDYRQTAALRVCNSCPALDACRDWFDSLKPTRKPHGVIAGRIHRLPKPGRARKTA